jgi:hypothetical protein
VSVVPIVAEVSTVVPIVAEVSTVEGDTVEVLSVEVVDSPLLQAANIPRARITNNFFILFIFCDDLLINTKFNLR